jgi:hypothetical protein
MTEINAFKQAERIYFVLELSNGRHSKGAHLLATGMRLIELVIF